MKNDVNKLIKVEFDLCSQCTRRCGFCDPGIPRERRDRPIFLPVALIEEICSELACLGYRGHITIAGHGEPFLHPDVVGCVRAIRQRLQYAFMTIFTNGELVTSEQLIMLNSVRAFENGYLIYDNYENSIGKKFVSEVERSGIDLGVVLCRDHVNTEQDYSTRAGNVKASTRIPQAGCNWPVHRLLLTAEGYWITCCNDLRHENRWYGSLHSLLLNRNRTLFCKRLLSERTTPPCNRCEDGDTKEINPSDYVKMIEREFCRQWEFVAFTERLRVANASKTHKASPHIVRS